MIKLNGYRPDSLTGKMCRFSYVLAKNISGRELKPGEGVMMKDVQLEGFEAPVSDDS